MRSRTVIVGVVILVVGLALLGVGVLGALRSLTINRTFTQPNPGEFVSAEIVLNSSSILAVASPASDGGIVHAQDLARVNSTSLASLAVPATTTGGTDTYRSLVGDFYYVAFASTQPGTTIVATPVGTGAIAVGGLALVGLLCILLGIVVAIVGAVQKKKPEAQHP